MYLIWELWDLKIICFWLQVQRPQEAYLDSKIVFNCVRKIKEKADTRRGNRSIFKTKDFAGFLKHSKYEDSSAGKIDWKMLGRRMQHAINRYLIWT